MSRKDSRGMFANVLGPQTEQVAAPRAASPHLLKVAAGMRQIQEKGEALDRMLKEGDHVIEIDPSEISPSAIADRFDGEYDGTAIEEIVSSMRERGQIVPGLVRPREGGGYQIVFGRRRLAAAKALGIRFRAIVRELTDEQAIVFQGEENTNRNDLSFIEKCAFALSLESAGYRRDIICASLATGKSHISEMLRIANAIPRDILMKIGRSTDIGRRRWLAFMEAWTACMEAQERVNTALASVSPGADRFSAALAALVRKDRDAPAGAEPPDEQGRPETISANGFLIATVAWPASGPRLSFTKAVPADFVEFLGERMEDLHNEFMRRKTSPESSTG